MAFSQPFKRVHVGGNGMRMSRTCFKCRKPRPIQGGTTQAGKRFLCAGCKSC